MTNIASHLSLSRRCRGAGASHGHRPGLLGGFAKSSRQVDHEELKNQTEGRNQAEESDVSHLGCAHELDVLALVPSFATKVGNLPPYSTSSSSCSVRFLSFLFFSFVRCLEPGTGRHRKPIFALTSTSRPGSQPWSSSLVVLVPGPRLFSQTTTTTTIRNSNCKIVHIQEHHHHHYHQ